MIAVYLLINYTNDEYRHTNINKIYTYNNIIHYIYKCVRYVSCA